MNWTPEQYQDYLKRRGLAQPATIQPLISYTSTKPKLNKTEQEYRLILKFEFPDCHIYDQAIKLQVGDHRCWYTPDYAVIMPDGKIMLVEVKGAHVWDDARVKYQSSKKQYPCFLWRWAQKTKEGWQIQ